MTLIGIELLQGITTLTFVISFIIVGIRILTKYRTSQKIEHVTMGLAWIFLSSAWWGSAVNFFFLIFNSKLHDTMFLFFSNAFLPIAIITWLYSIFHILHQDLEKKVMVIVLLLVIPYWIVLISLLFTFPNLVGTIMGSFKSNLTIMPLLFQIIVLITGFISGVYFASKSMKVDDPKVQWRGRFLLIAFISLLVGSLLDAILLGLVYNEITLIVIRSILISASIEYYLAFFTPQRLLNWLAKD